MPSALVPAFGYNPSHVLVNSTVCVFTIYIYGSVFRIFVHIGMDVTRAHKFLNIFLD